MPFCLRHRLTEDADLTDDRIIRDPEKASLTQARDGDRLTLGGALVVWTLPQLSAPRAPVIELSGVDRMDTAGAWYLADAQAAGSRLDGLSAAHRHLIETVSKAIPDPEPAPVATPYWRQRLEDTGRRVLGGLEYFRDLAEYLGRFLRPGCARRATRRNSG